MSHAYLRHVLNKAGSRCRRQRLRIALSIAWWSLACVVTVLAAALLRFGWTWNLALPVMAAVAVATTLASMWLATRGTQNQGLWIARKLEHAFPDLDSSLLAAVEQRPALPAGRYGFLQQAVISRVVEHSQTHQWLDIVPASRVLWSRVASSTGLLAVLVALAALSTIGARRNSSSEQPTLAFDEAATDAGQYEVSVEPGDTEIEKGTSLLVIARFAGQLPPETTLVFRDGAESTERQSMSKSLDDPIFGGRIAQVATPLEYHVEFAGHTSDNYRVTVFEYPRLERADAELRYPSYTNMEHRLVQDVRRVSVVEGTEVYFTCKLNKPVAESRLVSRDDETYELSADAEDGTVVRGVVACDRTRKLELRLRDSDGRENQVTAEFVLNVLPNRPPDLKLVQPGRDVQVSPLEELSLAASAWDDYGVKRVGVSFAIAGDEEQERILAHNIAARQRVTVEQLVAMEALNAEPDQLVSYHFWAEDTAADGTTRRVDSDMYFAEVRHFEEIFRQGQQPTDGQQQRQQQQQQQQGNQNAARAEQVADLQKQVITATWNLIRREKGDEPSATFDADTQLIAESQAAVRQQADELASQLSDPQSIEYAEEVYRHIDRAVEELTKAHDERDISALRPALAAEQSAYQSMLRLRAREHEVVRANQQQQQQQSSQNSSSNRMQQQLQQLELREDRNRYETQNLAQPQEETAEQREDRQVLNRLRELARRQDDLNERVKELQSALEAAQTPDEREEIERQLKRLREEQQQILRDADELRDRMEQPQNQERMSEQREQMEQARENARQASEALEQGQVSRAAAEGSRAQDQFEELRDEFQNRTSDQFTEQMRQMREQVQEVERRQRDIAQQMEDGQPVGDEPPSLRSENPNEDLGERLNDQRLRVDELVQQIRDTVEEAEQIEPLLAEELYDTYRDAEMNNPQQNLNRARVMWQAGLRENARQEEQVAREQIERLREGIERAAESVLGDETDALRRAEQQLRQLTEDVQNEVARETNVANQRRADSDNNAAQGQEGEPQQGATRESNQQRQQQDGRQPDGPQQDGQQQDGQQRGGQRQTTRPQDGQSQDRQQGGGRDEQQEGQQQEGQQQEGQQQEGQQQEGQQGGQQQGRQQQGGQQQGGQQQGDRQQGGEPQGGQQQQAGQQRGGSRVNDGGLRRGGGDIDFLGGAWDDWDQVIRGPIERVVSPISGDDFVEWSDRLREVEEMISVPELRAEATRIREQARTIRRDVRRHSEAPNWELVDMSVIKPLHELQQRISEEVLRRQGGDAIVPIDRDPVPLRFERAVREYYEQLGTGQ